MADLKNSTEKQRREKREKPSKVPSPNVTTDSLFSSSIDNVLETVKIEFNTLRKKANTKIDNSIKEAITEAHKFMATKSYIENELATLPSDLDETKDLKRKEIKIAYSQKKKAVEELSEVAEKNDIIGESIANAEQAAESISKLEKLTADTNYQKKKKEAISQYDATLKTLKSFLS